MVLIIDSAYQYSGIKASWASNFPWQHLNCAAGDGLITKLGGGGEGGGEGEGGGATIGEKVQGRERETGGKGHGCGPEGEGHVEF